LVSHVPTRGFDKEGYVQYVSVLTTPPSRYVWYEKAAGAEAKFSTLMPIVQNDCAEPVGPPEPTSWEEATMS